MVDTSTHAQSAAVPHRPHRAPPPRLPVPTPDDDLFMRNLADDADDLEESPWMTMGEMQFWSASSFAYALAIYARTESKPWYIASMLPVTFPWPLPPHLRAFDDEATADDSVRPRTRQIAPDTMVALEATMVRGRTSFDMVGEGRFPPFVLEVVSPSSKARDEQEKKRAYDLLGVQEYVIFTPLLDKPSTLVGWRRGQSGRFEPWPLDGEGRLWSAVLSLYILVRDERVRAQTGEGEVLLTPEEEAEGRRQEAEGRRRVEAALQRESDARRAEEAARQRAEEELAQLRRELERRDQQ